MLPAQIDAAIQQARLHSEIWSVLTPAQQEQAAAGKADRQARTEGHASRP
jgi:hypothetical protein